MLNLLEAIAKFVGTLNRSDYKHSTTATAALDTAYSVDATGWVNKDTTPVRREPTRKMGGAMQGPRFIVLHYTANNSTEGTINVFKKYSVSAHFVLGRDGELVQMVPLNRIAWHAGKSRATSKWGTRHAGLNKYAIGIEIVNYGYKAKHVPSKQPTAGWLEAQHENGGPTRKWQPYTDVQLREVEELVAALMQQYDIPAEHVLGHDEVSPDRKVDPGPAFPLDSLRSRLGFRM